MARAHPVRSLLTFWRRSMSSHLFGVGPTVWGCIVWGGLLLSACSIHLEPDEDADGVPARRDCNDLDSGVYPGAQETCDGRDNDCDGRTDDQDPDGIPSDARRWYWDHDLDGVGDFQQSVLACEPPPGTVSSGSDCDDEDPLVFPGQDERCDQVDNDCDGRIDDADPDALPLDVSPWYPDVDGDTYGAASPVVLACVTPSGYVSLGPGLLDCDDLDSDIHPGAYELCDGQDNDCDGQPDNDTALTTLWFPDLDQDGHGDPADHVQACPGPPGWVLLGDDCNDHNPTIYSGAPETCDGLDNSCDQRIDEGLLFPVYPDQDGDGFGTQSGGLLACSLVEGYALVPDDCQDRDASVYPGALERCNGRDNNCDGVLEPVATAFFQDLDSDGFGNEAVPTCLASSGYVSALGDCNDQDPAVHPGGEERPADGRDSDCGGTDGVSPHVGLTSSSRSALQDALDQAEEGMTVWVGPGHYLVQDLSFGGRALALRATHGATQTVLDAQGVSGHSVLSVTSGEDLRTWVDGFGLTGAVGGPRGTAVYILGASPSLTRCEIFDNYVVGVGGGAGLYLKFSSAYLADITFARNHVDYSGGALYMESSQPVLERIRFEDNSAAWGGGMYVLSSRPVIRDCSFRQNMGWSTGGGLYLSRSQAQLEDSLLEANGGGGIFASADGSSLQHCQLIDNDYWGIFSTDGSSTRLSQVQVRGSNGSGVVLGSGSFLLRHSTLVDNHSPTLGGGLYLFGGQARLEHVLLSQNSATEAGGGFFVSGGVLELVQSVVARGTDGEGCGGGRVDGTAGGQLQLEGSVLAFNAGSAVCLAEGAAFGTAWSILYSPAAEALVGATLSSDASSRIADPGFLRLDGDGLPVDFHLAIDSESRDMGGSACQDADGSACDPGLYGGASGAELDLDGDGYAEWYWPGLWSQSPVGVDPYAFDCDDTDPLLPLGSTTCDAAVQATRFH